MKFRSCISMNKCAERMRKKKSTNCTMSHEHMMTKHANTWRKRMQTNQNDCVYLFETKLKSIDNDSFQKTLFAKSLHIWLILWFICHYFHLVSNAMYHFSRNFAGFSRFRSFQQNFNHFSCYNFLFSRISRIFFFFVLSVDFVFVAQ